MARLMIQETSERLNQIVPLGFAEAVEKLILSIGQNTVEIVQAA